MKKTIALIVLFAGLGLAVRADDWSFTIADADNHPEVVFGLVPTYLRLGLEYSGLNLLPDRETNLMLFTGGGYGQRSVWTDAEGGPLDASAIDLSSETTTDARKYDIWRADTGVRVQQVLTRESEPALLAAYAQYELHWETPLENGVYSFAFAGPASAYPDQDGVLVNQLIVGAFRDSIKRGVLTSGLRLESSLRAAPDFLANEVVGRSNFYQLSATAKAFLPVFESLRANGLNRLSVYLADRAVTDLFLGDAVPQITRKPAALGTKMRGFEKNSYGTTLTFVNNFELRVAGPALPLALLYPRLHLFLDAGVYCGSYLNTHFVAGGFLSSAGFEVVLSLFGFIDVGYRGSFILAGENMRRTAFVGEIITSLLF